MAHREYLSSFELKEYFSPFGCFFRSREEYIYTNRIQRDAKVEAPLKTLEELNVIKVVKLLRENPEWKKQYKNSLIADKWKLEIRVILNSSCYEEVWDYALKELTWIDYVEHNFPEVESSGFHLGCDEKIVYSDIAIKEDTRNYLQKSVEYFVTKEFENGPDYHPDSSNQKVDIAHPSLYPVQYRKTPVYVKGELQLAKELQYEDLDKLPGWGLSRNFQWLPALVYRCSSSNLSKLKFGSYINNIHPDHKNLYGAIEDVLTAAVPGINLSLAMMKLRSRIRVKRSNDLYDEMWQKFLDDHYGRVGEVANGRFYKTRFEAIHRAKFIKVPKPKYEVDPPLDFGFSLYNFPYFKVIVQLSNVELTPECPDYAGEPWKLLGTANEDIVAASLYFYKSENITGSKILFRTYFESLNNDNSQHGFQKIYGVDRWVTFPERKVGSINCKEGRVVAFPNWYQYRIEPFNLDDTSKPGCLKMLCVYIVDPYNTKTVTSATVPPQQPEWVEKQMQINKLRKNSIKDVSEPGEASGFDLLPPSWPTDIQNFDAISYNVEAAKKVRLKLIADRVSLREDDDSPYVPQT